MDVRGVHYDVGHRYATDRGIETTRPRFDLASVESDMATIAGALHANTVRVAGTDPGRLRAASRAALDAGLAVWLSPHPADLASDEIVAYLAEAARIAEDVRSAGGQITMVAGCELSLFAAGYLPGATLDERLSALTGSTPVPDLSARFEQLPHALNSTLASVAAAIKDRFAGPVTYASAPWEVVDWAPFDVVSVDLYRDSTNRIAYRDLLRGYGKFGKPIVVSEFGCCTYQGAAEAGGAGFMIIDDGPAPTVKRPPPARSEAEQANYAKELLAIFETEELHGAFWHTFAGWTFPHRPDPETDLDLGSFGLVKIHDSFQHPPIRVPKQAFYEVAAPYATYADRTRRA
ncbi:hypothetical protein CLV47_10458 [Antricoccus suffuscus]|uniref:Abortive infection protein n=1 Tax=Antricoccus suffuscus TaxID=1629062 RepID=A0A2T1A2F2_9ACTN|nr:hypothetical protein [Antricoccus suffuscus]PRZ42714.1 hypothetical protein CLV47_10458 [Antricoccus suffuscus]